MRRAALAVLLIGGCRPLLGEPIGESRFSDPTFRINSLGMTLRLVLPGEFRMGSTPEEAARFLEEMEEGGVSAWYRQSPPTEAPPRTVRIEKVFFISAHETTVAQFRAFVEATGYRTDAERDGRGADGRQNGRWRTKPEFNWRHMGYDRADDMPVVNVSWNDAVAFCEWLGRKERRTYRLPTEAEWEYACRAGSTTPYPWGTDASKRDEHVWHGGNSGGDAHPVGTKKPNAWGLYDMCGNVYEYCSDRFGRDAAKKVVRSGSWGTHPMHCRSAFRGDAGTGHRNRRDGFRIVRSAE